jgi:hypothetical protein
MTAETSTTPADAATIASLARRLALLESREVVREALSKFTPGAG